MTQDRALEIMQVGGNIFLTGEPGSGKTHVTNMYIAYLEACGLTVAVTASTGIAATHIGGMTIHAWSGVGIKDSLSAYELDQIASREKVAKRVKKAHVLIIDEISMLDGKVVDMVNAICKTIRQNSDSFGGLQVVFVGDFFQLPPVTMRGDIMRYAFESRGWEDARPIVCYLTEQYRQEDETLLGLLKSIRRNEIEEEHFTLLQDQKDIEYEDIEPTKLYTHNADVDAVNSSKLSELKTPLKKFKMSGGGNKQMQQSLVKNCLSPELLELKEDAMVMCTKNNFESGYVNGTLGRVVDFNSDDGYPVIETTEGKTIKIKPTSWEMAEDGKVLASIDQIPLRLAWAITVHKSQGMSLDAAEIDLSKSFVYGQGYVALSRVRTLAGLKMIGMSSNALHVDPKVVAFDERFRNESDDAGNAFEEMEKNEVTQMHKNFVSANGGNYIEGNIEPTEKKAYERVHKESTSMITKNLLLDKKSVKEIAKTRDMVESTIWSHVEKLVEKNELNISDINHLFSSPEWDKAYTELAKAMDECGTEKLKPIFEYAKEKYDYDIVRIARIKYLLSKNTQTDSANSSDYYSDEEVF